MAFNGVRLFRYALLGEIGSNVMGALPCLLAPETVLSYLVRGPNDITPVAKSLTQWYACCHPRFQRPTNRKVRFGGMILTAFTIPIILSYPNPRPSQGGDPQIVAWRRLAYMTLGAGEVGLGTIAMIQFLQGDSGFTDSALLGVMAFMGVFSAMRGFFLYARPSWMEAQENAKKAQ
ncbi:hypothetical protein BAUCODRAFT_298019 [Baudoinia panamericana UAMH 10762]|uniref:Uncharacterized protein n=1 Tax=Baudoinia panamericana (strain UAMH 10762) TaxID=717646 RepID=M2MJR7_BAUPA|nr:uncharacterized protein BAUCODRAFT_298019 [Baudoinia panamericana UAMH 10762]EMC91563.1 hypothetical protein BAUCODRAFT_298019 [Baudoinia panamericana UAMH 10762]